MVVSEVMNCVRSTPEKSLKSREGSMAISDVGPTMGSVDEMKGLGL